MIETKTLLPELKKLVTDLSEDLLARSTAKNDPYSAKVDTGLREAYAQIEKGGRTADAFEVWREDYLDQVAVAWVLGCVFVRFMEDNHLIDECWLAGEGAESSSGTNRRKLAEDTHELYFRAHPHDSDREYFEHVFHEVGKIPACRDLFAEGKTPLWAVGPSGDMAMKLLAFWRDVVPETGELQRSFEVEDGDTRFLGDLYQDLSERARKKYALLQTPVFVEEFILDRTLNPAIDEFGLDEVRMIDPTCGSGHFLLGSFARLFDLWIKREDNEVVAAQKALDGVWGCDINPFAVAIARFRLIVAALRACGIKRLKDAPAWNIHLATGDSLLFGSRWDREGKKKSEQQFLGTPEESWAPEIYACEDKEAISEVLGQQYHAVVGNPPYINVSDKALNAAYRNRYSSCYRSYSLGVPFTERFFDLAYTVKRGDCGYVGMITTNSFMKREFGKKLIEDFFPTVDLTHVVDTSGAFIPGHTTPTVILFGNNRPPQSETVRAVLGIKGEPTEPIHPSDGLVWNSLLRHIDVADAQDEFTSSSDTSRSTFSSHPWSIGGGGAAELKELLDSSCNTILKEHVNEIGFGAVTREDEAYQISGSTARRHGIDTSHVRPLVSGDEIRDWTLANPGEAIFPYDPESLKAVEELPAIRFLWPWKTQLSIRVAYGLTQLQRGLTWFEYSMFFTDRARTPLYLAFAFVATHNHFVLDRGGKVFNRSAPIIKLPADATEDDHLLLLGLLNSSTACFWMKQVFYPKSSAVGDISTEKGKPEANRYEFAGTGMLAFPVPDEELLRSSRVLLLSRRIDSIVTQMMEVLPDRIISKWDRGCLTAELRDGLAESEGRYAAAKGRVIALQEELDWEVYRVYGLTTSGSSDVVCDDETLTLSEHVRPFMWEDNSPASGIPEALKKLYQDRRKTLTSDAALRTIETLVFKRPWWGRQGVYGSASRTYPEWTRDALENWLLDRLELQHYWPNPAQHEPRLQSVAELSDKASGDHEFLEVAAIYRGREDFDVAALVAELVQSETVPLLPVLRYKPTGLRKREVWEKTWELQRKEDAGEDVGEIKVPPKYASTDFQSSDYWRLRGKLDVPKERWISFPHCETESDPSLVVGWAGWNHLQQATALIAYYDARKREGWDAKRLTPLLAGLDQLLPWIHQWHPEIDPEFGETAGQSFETMLKADAHELGLTLEDIRAWEPPKKTTTRRKRTTK